MSAAFPTERGAKRAFLLAAVERIRDVVAAGAEEAERLRTLPAATIRALCDSGLLALKVPESLGGASASGRSCWASPMSIRWGERLPPSS